MSSRLCVDSRRLRGCHESQRRNYSASELGASSGLITILKQQRKRWNKPPTNSSNVNCRSCTAHLRISGDGERKSKLGTPHIPVPTSTEVRGFVRCLYALCIDMCGLPLLAVYQALTAWLGDAGMPQLGAANICLAFNMPKATDELARFLEEHRRSGMTSPVILL